MKSTINKNIIIPKNNRGFDLISINSYEYFLEELILPDESKLQIEQIIKEFKKSKTLEKYNLLPKLKILLCGSPGTGKTFTAKVVSSILGIPLVLVKLDAVFESYMGYSCMNMNKIFNFIKDNIYVVLFDEFDSIGKTRDDAHEVGEMKRILNNLLQTIDIYEGKSIIFAATNYHTILDYAIWRRFDDVIFYKNPTPENTLRLLNMFLAPIPQDKLDFDLIVKDIENFSPYEIKTIAHEAMKISILEDRSKVSKNDIDLAIKRMSNKKAIRTQDIDFKEERVPPNVSNGYLVI